ncbi:MAG: hypothetical protein HY898_31105 [Deltaproteobacteria bacterium]|nr:hypothetical protein [Deltaproteobacteria bacterium]
MKHIHGPIAALIAPLAAALLGCGAESWTPPAPAGVTYQYDYQGFRERKTNVVAGTFAGPAPGMGMAYGGAFSFRNDSELRGRGEADPFAESTPLDGVRFNEHLANQGRRLLPPGGAPPPTPSAIPPKAPVVAPSASVAPPAKAVAPPSASTPPPAKAPANAPPAEPPPLPAPATSTQAPRSATP